MAEDTPDRLRVPIEARVNLLIVGGTGAGVSLARTAAAAGHSVFLTTSRPYLGEDLCGDMRLWPGPAAHLHGELSRDLFPDAPHPSTPMQVKLTLEQGLVEAGVPFLFNMYPAGLVHDDDGKQTGVWFATRSGPLAVLAEEILDCTTEKILSLLEGRELHAVPRGSQSVLHTTLCLGEGQDAQEAEVIARREGFAGEIGGSPYSLSARTYRLEVDFKNGSLRDCAAVEDEIIARCWVPTEYAHQERILLEKDAAEQDPVAAMDAVEHGLPGLSKGQPSLLPERGHLEISLEDLPVLERCDVLVLGGGTAGVPAAIAAGRAGADTILVESTDLLGGVGTVGQIAKYWCGNRVGFTREIDEGVYALEADPKQVSCGTSWSIAAKAEWYRRQCAAAGVTVLYRSLCSGATVEKGKVTSLLIATPHGVGRIQAKAFIDASGCADIAAAAGAPVRTTDARHVAVQGTGLAGLDPTRDYHNSDHNFCDDTDVHDTTAFLVSSKLKFRDHFDAGQLVDSRERRQIIGEIELGPVDLLAERRYPDTICVSSSNFDSHGFTVHPMFMCKAPDKKRLWADVPFRALLPLGLEGVITTGLGLSAHRDALPVVRMQADVQNHGYAAGYAAALAAENGCELRALDIRTVQRHLVEIGSLPERVLEESDNFPLPDTVVAEAVQEGWDDYRGLAVIFAAEERSKPLLKAALEDCPDDIRRRRCSLILALMGEADGRRCLTEYLEATDWDEGWNYRGMGQFGMSLSEVDAHLIALGNIGNADTWNRILDKLQKLPEEPAFSHCRAVAEASEALFSRCPDDRIAGALADILSRPGLSGHDQPDLKAVQADVTADPCETAVRNRALREIHLARALFRCGDHDNLGRSIMTRYAKDMRGHFARHARAVLAESAIPEPV